MSRPSASSAGLVWDLYFSQMMDCGQLNTLSQCRRCSVLCSLCSVTALDIDMHYKSGRMDVKLLFLHAVTSDPLG